MRRAALSLALALVPGCVSRLIVERDDAADAGHDGGADDDEDSDDDSDDDDDGDSLSDSGIGDLPEDCDVESHEQDCDSDGIPDGDDPMPEDPGGAGPVRTDVIYVHDGSTLSTFDPLTYQTATVGPFLAVGSVLDIAIDRFGLLYAVDSSGLYICDPETVECDRLGDVPANSLGFVPAGILDPVDDVLLSISGNRVIHALLQGPSVTVVEVGTVGGPYSSSGDVAALPDGRVVFTSPDLEGSDVIVELDPATGAAIGELAPAHSDTWGLAVWGGILWAFDAAGTARRYDPVTFAPEDVARLLFSVYGAAAHPAAAD